MNDEIAAGLREKQRNMLAGLQKVKVMRVC